MVQLSGTYNNGNVTLDEPVHIDKPVKVLVTFLDENIVNESDVLATSEFSFAKGQEILKDLKSSLSDAVIEERRSGL